MQATGGSLVLKLAEFELSAFQEPMNRCHSMCGMMPFIAPETSVRTTLRVASALAAAIEAAATVAVSLRPPYVDTLLQMVPDTSVAT